MAVNFSEFHVKNGPLCLRKKTWLHLRKKTYQTVEGKTPVLRIICKGLENGL